MKTKGYKHTIETKNFISNSKLKAVSQYDKNNNFIIIYNLEVLKNSEKTLLTCLGLSILRKNQGQIS
jgi:hypothetical protein